MYRVWKNDSQVFTTFNNAPLFDLDQEGLESAKTDWKMGFYWPISQFPGLWETKLNWETLQLLVLSHRFYSRDTFFLWEIWFDNHNGLNLTYFEMKIFFYSLKRFYFRFFKSLIITFVTIIIKYLSIFHLLNDLVSFKCSDKSTMVSPSRGTQQIVRKKLKIVKVNVCFHEVDPREAIKLIL